MVQPDFVKSGHVIQDINKSIGHYIRSICILTSIDDRYRFVGRWISLYPGSRE